MAGRNQAHTPCFWHTMRVCACISEAAAAGRRVDEAAACQVVPAETRPEAYQDGNRVVVRQGKRVAACLAATQEAAVEHLAGATCHVLEDPRMAPSLRQLVRQHREQDLLGQKAVVVLKPLPSRGLAVAVEGRLDQPLGQRRHL